MIATAPGKVVLWGEYAVLNGAPAAIMALNRLATVKVSQRTGFSSFSAEGFLTAGVHSAHPENLDLPITSMFQSILKALHLDQNSDHYQCHMDTAAFYIGGQKLGLGSSAALCVSMYSAICHLSGRTSNLAEALAIHREWQGGSGSGLDIAASWHGGVIRFQNGDVKAITWPEDLHFQILFTGKSASTKSQIGKFSEWLRKGSNKPLDTLCERSVELFAAMDDEAAWMAYTEALRALDTAGSLNIFTHDHERLATIATDLGMVYKPCGAGGGDIGIAISHDQSRMDELRAQVTQVGFTVLHTEIAKHGIQVRKDVE